MNHQGNRNILAQMSILSAICENIHNCYPCDKWAWLEGQAPSKFQVLSAGGRVTPRRNWCHALNEPPFLYFLCHSCSTPIYNAHHKRSDVNMCAAIWMAWSLHGAFPRRLASLLLWGEDHLSISFLCLCTWFRAASVKCMSQPSIKGALTCLNYR